MAQLGVDISPRVVEVYNSRASTQGLEPHEMRTVSSLRVANLQQQRFDLAVVSHSSLSSNLIVIPRVLIVSCRVALVFDGLPPFPFGRTSYARRRRIPETERHADCCQYYGACAACC